MGYKDACELVKLSRQIGSTFKTPNEGGEYTAMTSTIAFRLGYVRLRCVRLC